MQTDKEQSEVTPPRAYPSAGRDDAVRPPDADHLGHPQPRQGDAEADTENERST